jgi:hypothetical protein
MRNEKRLAARSGRPRLPDRRRSLDAPAGRRRCPELVEGFGATAAATDWVTVEKELFGVIGLELLLAAERVAVERARTPS